MITEESLIDCCRSDPAAPYVLADFWEERGDVRSSVLRELLDFDWSDWNLREPSPWDVVSSIVGLSRRRWNGIRISEMEDGYLNHALSFVIASEHERLAGWPLASRLPTSMRKNAPFLYLEMVRRGGSVLRFPEDVLQ